MGNGPNQKNILLERDKLGIFQRPWILALQRPPKQLHHKTSPKRSKIHITSRFRFSIHQRIIHQY